MSNAKAGVPREPSLHRLLYQASRQAIDNLRRVVEAEGVPVEFWRVLEVLADERGRSMSALAEEAGMRMSATSKLIDRMTDAALVQRSVDPTDQRRVILYISDFGLQKVAHLCTQVDQNLCQIQASLSPPREKQLRKLLQEFIQAQRQEAE
jgi:DNA-binding MarR family transcriptional regulator